MASSSSSADLIDGRVSTAQVSKAVSALCAHAAKQADQASRTELIEREDHVWLTVGTRKISSVKKLKPVKIALPHPLIDPRTTSICLITKDPQRQYKDLLEAHNIKYVARVVGIEKLKGKFKAYEARRQLMNEHGLFLVDERVVPLLPKLLGTKFFAAKKTPIPVNLTRKDLKGELERAITSTYFRHSPGNSHSIRLAALPPANGMTAAKVAANACAAIASVGQVVPGGWDNVLALNVKTANSMALPVWTADVTGRWTGMEDDEAAAEDAEMSDDSEAGADDLAEPAPAAAAPFKPAASKKAAVTAAAAPAAAPAKKSPKAAEKKKTTTAAALVAPAPPHPAPAPPALAKDELKQKKKAAGAPAGGADKKKVSGAGAAGKKSIKESVIGKKGGAKKK